MTPQTITMHMADENKQHKIISYMFILFICRDKINDSGLQSSMIKCKLYNSIRLYVFAYYREFVFLYKIQIQCLCIIPECMSKTRVQHDL